MKKAAALALAMVMALSLASVAFAADFPDMPDDWSTAALEAAVENGLISGKDGKIAASDSLTRAEMATIITRAFNAEVEDDISFTDVKNDTWYKTYAAKAVHMGAMNGKGSAFAGADSITRQEVFVVLARVLKLADGDAADLAAFSDADKTASWAVPAVAALVKAGYVSGSNGALNPTASITRAEFSQVMYNIFHNAYLTKAGTYEEVDGDNVIISSTNVTVKGVDVKGDVVVADGVGNGDVYFEDVTIGGRLVVRGGGMNSIHFKDSKTGTVIMSKVDGNVRLVIEGESAVETVAVEAGKASTDVRVEGTVGSVVVNDNASTVVLADATVAKVEVNKANTTVSLAGKTTVAEMTVAAGATDTQLQAEPTAEITKLDTAEDVFIDHEDVIKDCNDDEKVNPERPEESAAPSESKAPSEDTTTTTKHTHTFETQYNGETGKTEYKPYAYDGEYHAFKCAGSEEGVDYCGELVLRSHEWKTVGENTTCSVCGQKKPAAIEEKSDNTTVATGDGKYDCTKDAEGTAIEGAKHTWGEPTITKPDNCTTEGAVTTYVYHCTATKDGKTCGGTRTVTKSTTGVHSWGTATWKKVNGVNQEPSCSTGGTKVQTCVNCAQTMEVPVAATGNHAAAAEWTYAGGKHFHACANAKWVKNGVIVAAGTDGAALDCTKKFAEATCTSEAVIISGAEGAESTQHKVWCPTCKNVTTAAASHNTDKLVNKGEKHVLTCSVCGFVAEANKAGAEHHYEYNEEAKCNKCACGAVEPNSTHTITWHQVTLTNGTLAHYSVCSVAGCDKVGHNVGTMAEPVACDWTGNADKTLCKCGRTHTHTYAEATEGAPASGQCTICGKAHACTAATMSATYSSDGTNHWKVCTVCHKKGAEEAHQVTSCEPAQDKNSHVGPCTVCGKTGVTKAGKCTYKAAEGENPAVPCNVEGCVHYVAPKS